MNLTDLKDQLSQQVGCTLNESDVLLEATIEALKDYAKNLDSVAIPGFGSFSCAKTEEQIVLNPKSGQNMLTPPQIRLSFKSSVVLRKKFVG